MTAVEWLEKRFLQTESNLYEEDFVKAKEMEQNQIVRAVNHSIMKLDEMRAEAIKQNITIGELYIKINKDEKIL